MVKQFSFLALTFLAVSVSGFRADIEPVQAYDFCFTCISFANDQIQNLDNEIKNGGIIAGCDDLCNLLNTTVASYVCNSICDQLGLRLFEQIVQKADLDSIYFCQLAFQCPRSTGGALTINDLVVQPTEAVIGTLFQFNFDLDVTQATGTGEIQLGVKLYGGGQKDYDYLNKGFDIGNQLVQVKVDSGATLNGTSIYGPGVYDVSVIVCEGTCHSGHEWSKTLATTTTSFTIDQ